MRLHRLTVTAFGPFAATETVDFDALGAAGLFLFTGATGAGKTSLLDAVSFALYGEVPGPRKQVSRALRSDHAAPGVAPQVVLDLTLRGRRLRVTRSPAWERAKRRGTGTTTEQSRVLVEERRSDEWAPLSTRLDEAGELLRELTGLTPSQFCQVVLLPQGQFAEFLRADADTRRKLLESLFDTGRFAAVESWLVGQRQAAHRELEDADAQVRQVLARLAEASRTEPPDDLLAAPTDDSVMAWVTDVQSRAVSERDLADRSTAAAVGTADVAAARLVELTSRAERQARRDDLRARLAVLAAGRGARDEAAQELATARAVAPVLPLLLETGRRQTELEQARVVAVDAQRAVADELTGLTTATLATGTDGPSGPLLPSRLVVARARATRDELGRLRLLADRENAALLLEKEADEFARRAVQLQTRAETAAAWLADAAERRAALAAARDDALRVVESLPGLDVARDAAKQRLVAARRRDEVQQDLRAARDALRDRTDEHQVARAAWLAVRSARLAGMAAELARGLREGIDCPVCGSSEHPRPATGSDADVSAEDERAAEAQVLGAESRRQAAADLVARTEAALAASQVAAGGDLPADQLAEQLAAATAAAVAAARTARQLPAREEALRDFDQERETRTREQTACEAEKRQLGARVDDHRRRAQQELAALAEARGDDATVGARLSRLMRVADQLDGLAAELGEVERLVEEVDDAQRRAAQAVAARGLRSLDAVAAAARNDDRMTALEATVHAYDTEFASVGEQLADPALSDLPDLTDDELSVAAEQARSAAAERDLATAAAAAAVGRARDVDRLAESLRAALSDRVPAATRHRLVDGLSRLAEGKSGDNRLRMSLSAYVLAARLEQVAVSASQRLLRMSSGRYSLVHTADGGPGRTRGGLALRVLDAWTGIERDPASLSGGETFSASLALALGLAEVVTAEAGGALLETLFVDEGFGTLDDETLDEVMSVLDDLREGGRVVGLVSHVADLRQRIPVQLRVEKGRHGSVVRG
jgi:exonuclease SbcC